MKKLLVLFVAAVLTAAVFTGCAANDTTPTVTTTTSAAEETTAPETATPAKEPETQKKDNGNNNNTAETTTKANTSAEVKISKAEAKATALKHAELTENDISRYSIELDKEREYLVYEIEFNHGGYEYDYEINADSGKIIKAEKEIGR